MSEKVCFPTLGLMLAFTCFTSGCSIVIGETIHGSGERIVQQREVGDFDGLDVSGSLHVKVHCGEKPSLEISGDDNIVEHVIAKVEDGILELSLEKGSYSLREPLEIIVTCAQLAEVEVSGASEVSVEAIETKEFTVDASGASKVTLEGNTEELRVDTSGASRVAARHLAADRVVVDASGASQAWVNSAESIRGEASGASNIKYAGYPANEDISSSGGSSVKSTEATAVE